MPDSTQPFLIVTTGNLRCALPLQNVAEVLRPYRMKMVDGEGGVVGSMMVRGRLLQVIDLMQALGGNKVSGEQKRILRMQFDDGREAALLVETVIGTRPVRLTDLGALSPSIGIDPSLLRILTASGTLSDRVWSQTSETSVHRSVPD